METVRRSLHTVEQALANDALREVLERYYIGKKVRITSTVEYPNYVNKIGTITGVSGIENCVFQVEMQDGAILNPYRPGHIGGNTPQCELVDTTIFDTISNSSRVPQLGDYVFISSENTHKAEYFSSRLNLLCIIREIDSSDIPFYIETIDELDSFWVNKVEFATPEEISAGGRIYITDFNRKPEVGDYVVVLPEDTNYHQFDRDTCNVMKLTEHSMSEWYSLDYPDGRHKDSYNLIRLATPQEILDMLRAYLNVTIPSSEESVKLTYNNCEEGTKVVFKPDCEESLRSFAFDIRTFKSLFPDWQTKIFTVKSKKNETVKLQEFPNGACNIQYFNLLLSNKKETKIIIPEYSLPAYTGYKKEVLDCLLTTPQNISVIKAKAINRGYYDKVVNSLMPYKMGIEIECIESLSRHLQKEGIIEQKEDSYLSHPYKKQMNQLLGCSDYSDDRNSIGDTGMCEQRLCFKGHKEIIALQRFCALLTQYCVLDTTGGIHIHFDFPEAKDSDIARKIKNIATKYLDTLDSIVHYQGNFNFKQIGIDQKGTWINIRTDLNTIEIRTIAPTFDYTKIVTQIIAISNIITNIRKELKLNMYKL